MTRGAALEARDIVAGYAPEMDILRGVSLRVGLGEAVCIIGPNGAGKSTLLKVIFGLLAPREGRVLLDGVDITGAGPREVVQRGVGYVPQVANVFPTLTVRENLEMGGWTRREGSEAAIDRVMALFPALRERARQKVGTMSGGERQMVAMGRSLVMEPRLLLLDEPSAGLAPNLVDEVFANVRRIAATGASVLLVEQNARRGLAVADRGYVLDTGRNRYEGTGRELLDDPNVGKLYLGG